MLIALMFLLIPQSHAEDLAQSSIPVTAYAVEKKRIEDTEIKVSVVPAEGYEQSSIPVGYPRCLPAQGCPEPKAGGRVRFWFVGLEPMLGSTESGDVVGGNLGGGVFYMRRHKHGYYEFRNVVKATIARATGEHPGEVEMKYGGQAAMDNAIYYSTAKGPTEE